jgi:hypothetical protein
MEKVIFEFEEQGRAGLLNAEHEQLMRRYPKFSDMEASCKCCANCDNWVVDRGLMNRYEFNTCLKIGTAQMVKCCWWCEGYSGTRTEENIKLFKLKIVEQ